MANLGRDPPFSAFVKRSFRGSLSQARANAFDILVISKAFVYTYACAPRVSGRDAFSAKDGGISSISGFF